jgi:Flp pilus assembly protein TadG
MEFLSGGPHRRAGDDVLRRLKRTLRAEDGQAIVELALVLPILLLVLFGIFDFGSAVNDWNNETSLANVGARYAAVGSLPGTTADPTCGSNTTLPTYLVCEATHVYGMPSSSGKFGLQGPVTVKLCDPGNSTAAGQPFEVNVTAKYNWLPVSKLLGSGFLNATITGAATMRLENALPASLYAGTTLSTTGCTS